MSDDWDLTTHYEKGTGSYTGNARYAMETPPKPALFNFRPDGRHPKGKGGVNELPWIWIPGQDRIFLGPPNSFHTELIQRFPTIWQHYGESAEEAAKNYAANRHPEGSLQGRVEWPKRRVHMFNADVPDEVIHMLGEGFGAESVHNLGQQVWPKATDAFTLG